MKKLINSKTMIFILVAVFSVGGYLFWTETQQANPDITYSQVSYIADFSDARKLVGAVDNVFVGKVMANEGTHSPSGIPETLFRVAVEENIKGMLSAEVVVNQQGGYLTVSQDGVEKEVLHLVEEDGLLEIGQTYLFATRVGEDGKWHTVVPNFGDILIESEQGREQLMSDFASATQDQILYDPTLQE